jgi:hypothetical protein
MVMDIPDNVSDDGEIIFYGHYDLFLSLRMAFSPVISK